MRFLPRFITNSSKSLSKLELVKKPFKPKPSPFLEARLKPFLIDSAKVSPAFSPSFLGNNLLKLWPIRVSPKPSFFKIFPPNFNPPQAIPILAIALIKPLSPEIPSISLFMIVKKLVNKSTTVFTTVEFVIPIVKASQAFFNLFNLDSKLSVVFSNCL